MKKYRPYCSGFIVLYVLVAISLGDAVYTLSGQIFGSANEYMQNFSLFSYLIAALAVAYVWIYMRAQVCIDDKNIRIAFPANIRPPEGVKRAFFIFRQGDCDLKLIDKTFPLASIQRYGYVDDLGFSRVDQTNATENSPLLPVKEACFLTSDGKRYHMNTAIYSRKQRHEIFTRLQAAIGIAPEGSLAETLDPGYPTRKEEKKKPAKKKK